jgi:hypothetical protein
MSFERWYCGVIWYDFRRMRAEIEVGVRMLFQRNRSSISVKHSLSRDFNGYTHECSVIRPQSGFLKSMT